MSPKKKVLPPKPKQSLLTTPGETRVTKLPHKPLKKPSSVLTEERASKTAEKKSPDSKSTVANLVLAVGTAFSVTPPRPPTRLMPSGVSIRIQSRIVQQLLLKITHVHT